MCLPRTQDLDRGLEDVFSIFQLQSSHLEEGLDLRERTDVGKRVLTGLEVTGVRNELTGTCFLSSRQHFLGSLNNQVSM